MSAASGASDAAGLGRARAVAFVTPAFLLIAAFLVFPAVWTHLAGDDRLPAHRRAGGRPEVRRGLDNYTSGPGRPGVPQLAVADHRSSLRARRSSARASSGSSSRGRCASCSPRRSRRSSRRSSSWRGSCRVDRRVPLGGVPEQQRRHLGTILEHPRLRPGWSSTPWPRSSSTTPGAGLRSRCCCSPRLWGPCHRPSSRPLALAGAQRVQQFRDVVFPHIRGHILTNTLLISLWTFNDFGPYLLTAGGPDHATETLPVFIYSARALRRRAGLRLGDLLHHAADQPRHRAVVHPAAARAASEPVHEIPTTRRRRPTSPTAPRPGTWGSEVTRAVVGRILFYVLITVVSVFFALPMLWLVLAPFDATPTADHQDPGVHPRQLRGSCSTTPTPCGHC